MIESRSRPTLPANWLTVEEPKSLYFSWRTAPVTSAEWNTVAASDAWYSGRRNSADPASTLRCRFSDT